MTALAARERRRVGVVVLLLIGGAGIALAVWLANHRTPSTAPPTSPSSSPTKPLPPVPRLFSRDSIWNAPLPPDAPVDPTSPQLVARLATEIQRELKEGIGPHIATSVASTPFYVVERGQRRVRVILEPTNTPGAQALARALRSVPIPPGARPAAGSDAHLVVWQPSTDSMWELFDAVRRPNGWHARWGGAIRRVSQSPGYYTPSAWPGAAYTWGATATSLPVAGGTVRAAELHAGRIDHALAIALPYPRAGEFAWPAQRSDGTGGPREIPEGARLRLDPQLDLASLDLPPLTLMLARAAQRYGMIVRDQTHRAVGLYFEDPTPSGRNPYRSVYAGMSSNEVLAAFPWDHLQVLRMHLCTRTPCLGP